MSPFSGSLLYLCIARGLLRHFAAVPSGLSAGTGHWVHLSHGHPLVCLHGCLLLQDLETQKQRSVLDKYGGTEHLEKDPRVLYAQTEAYVEYSRDGR